MTEIRVSEAVATIVDYFRVSYLRFRGCRRLCLGLRLGWLRRLGFGMFKVSMSLGLAGSRVWFGLAKMGFGF